MIACLRLFLLLTLFCLISVVISGSETIPSKTTLGIAPDDEKYFKSEVIKCKDGSKKVPKEKLNDDFCDCADGTDEPGTSACPEGKFYCRNSGHIPLTLFSSRVNDGICDCCDGSDEYDGKVNCSNTCWEAGKVAREKLKKKIATYQDGAAIRKNEVEQAKEAIHKDEAELTKLKNEEKILKGLVQQLKARKEQIEKAEELERKEKEKEKEKEEKQKEAERKDNEVEKQTAIPNEEVENVEEAETEFHDQHAVEEIGDDEVDSEHQNNEDKSKYDASPTYEVAEQKAEHLEETVVGKESNDNKIELSSSYKETQEKEGEVSEDTEGLSKEELGRVVASRWTGEKVQDKSNEVDHNVKEEVGEDEAIPESSYDGYSSEAEESGRKYGDEDDTNVDDEYEEEDEDPLASYKPDEEDHDTDFSDVTTSSSSSWLERIQETVRNMIQQFNFFRTPVDKSEAENVRKEYDDSSSKLSQIQSRISSLTKKLSYDFGPEKEFYSFYNHCFESKQNKYVYKVCPFKEASQVEGHSTTRLGRWDKFEDSYRVMQFSSGDKCWNGPDRSLKVKLRCGLKNELTDVDEPSRCEYIALLSTPAVCVEERLKELQHKLDMLLQEQPPKHDEL